VGGIDLGTPTLIDGYANGWYVDPAVVGSGDLAFTITWKPQQAVWVAIALSAAAMVVCLALMLFGGRRRRPARIVAADPMRPVEPVVTRPWPFRPPPRSATDPAVRPSVLVALIVAAVFTVAAAVNITNQRAYPLLALAIGAALFVALRDGRWRSWLGLAAAGAYALTGAFVVLQQVRRDYPSDFIWPAHFEKVHIAALAAIFLLLAEAVTDLVRGAARSRHPSPGDGPSGSGGP
jgi:hypothetical protein